MPAGSADSDLRSAHHLRPAWQRACAKDASGNEIISRTPVPRQLIPANRIDPAAKVLTNLWAHANGPGSAVHRRNNFTANASVGGNNDQYNAASTTASPTSSALFIRYTYWTNLNLPIDPYKTKTCVDRCTEAFNTNQAVIGDTLFLHAHPDRRSPPRRTCVSAMTARRSRPGYDSDPAGLARLDE